MSDIEIEIQVKVESTSKLIDFLNKKAQFTGEKYQKDEYFTPKHKDYTSVRPVVEWLRVRKSEQDSVTYKKWHHDKDGKSTHCDEYETNIEDATKLDMIFGALEMKSIIVVDKKRLSWMYEDYEISLDCIKDLGDFVEIEYKGSDKDPDPKKITNEMVDFLKKIGCGKIERNYIGYPFMILYPDEVEFEQV